MAKMKANEVDIRGTPQATELIKNEEQSKSAQTFALSCVMKMQGQTEAAVNKACMCPHQAVWRQTADLLDSILAKHPEWKEKNLVIRKTDTRSSYIILNSADMRKRTANCN